MATGNFNMDDPAKQESIRRGHHDYLPTAGKHGTYVPKQYKHQEYPKMMGTWPKPEFNDFREQNAVAIPNELAQQRFAAALTEWDRLMTSSIVASKAEETQWLKENG